jgi:hypothetical protein
LRRSAGGDQRGKACRGKEKDAPDWAHDKVHSRYYVASQWRKGGGAAMPSFPDFPGKLSRTLRRT